MKELSGINIFSYVGAEPITPYNFVSYERNPTEDDYHGYDVGDRWLNDVSKIVWVLVERDENVATWQKLGTTGIRSFTPDTGITVEYDSNRNINVVGGTNITTVGSTNTLSIEVDTDTVVDSCKTDSGTAVPSSGELNVLGGTNINITGSGNTITVNVLEDATVSTYITDLGNASPAFGSLSVFGGTDLETSASGNTITAALTGDYIDSVVTDSGTASPANNILKIDGGLNINTSGSGNIVTVNVDNPGEGVVQSSAAGVFSASKGDDGELLIGATAGSPAWSTLTGGPDIDITNAANSVTVTNNSRGLPNIYNFKAYLDFNIPNSSSTYIPFRTTLWNKGNRFDPTVVGFVAPLKGLYFFMTNIYISNLKFTNNIFLSFRVVGVGATILQSIRFSYQKISAIKAGSAVSIQGMAVVAMNPGEICAVHMDMDSTVSIGGFISASDIRTWFSGYMLAQT